MIKRNVVLVVLLTTLFSSLFADNFAGITIDIYYLPTQILLTDYEGKRTGYDKETEKNIKEIANSTYSDEGLPGLPQHMELDVNAPDEGRYLLKIIGKKPDISILDILTYDETGRKRLVFTFESIISEGEEQEVELLYSPYAYDTTEVNRFVDLNLLKNETKTAFKHGFVKNKKLGKRLLKHLKSVEKNMKKKDKIKTKENLNQYIEDLKTEKEYLIKTGIQEPEFPRPKRGKTKEEKRRAKAWHEYRKYQKNIIRPVDVLINDAKTIRGDMK